MDRQTDRGICTRRKMRKEVRVEKRKNNKLELTLALVREMVAELNLDGVSGEGTIKQTIRMDRFREHYDDYEKLWFARR